MPMVPSFIVLLWLTGVLSLTMIGAGLYVTYEWYQRVWHYDSTVNRYIFDPNLGLNQQTALLTAGLALLLLSFAGSFVFRLSWALLGSRSAGPRKRPKQTRGGLIKRLPRPDGSELQVELYGPEDGIPIVLTHGWGANSTEWYDLKQQLSDRYRLIVWDLPGLGLSRRPTNHDYSLDNLARDLHSVLSLANGRPAILLGHSIGGMITLTFCRLFPEDLSTRVAGLVLVHTTYTNPLRTIQKASLYTALEKPVIIPLLHLTIWLSPLVWLMSWLSYLNGTAHLSTKRSGFGGTESWEQIEFVTRFQPLASPAVLARGMFGMLHYDATNTLQTITIPTLVVAGDRDPVCLPEASEHMRQAIPKAQAISLSPAKHMGWIEHNDSFAQTLRDFATACVKITG